MVILGVLIIVAAILFRRAMDKMDRKASADALARAKKKGWAHVED